jgi:hypothetical protein
LGGSAAGRGERCGRIGGCRDTEEM